MVLIKKKPNETDDQFLNRFRREVVDSGILEEARDRQHHIPRKQKRKEKKARLKYIDQKKRERNES